MRALHRLTDEERTEYIKAVSEGYIKPRTNETYLMAYMRWKDERGR